MVWDDSLWVKNRGLDYGSKYDEEWGYDIVNGHYQGCCGFGFPVSNDESADGQDFHDYCASMFVFLERDFKRNNETIEDLEFKIVIEDVTEPGKKNRVIWVYLLYP